MHGKVKIGYIQHYTAYLIIRYSLQTTYYAIYQDISLPLSNADSARGI